MRITVRILYGMNLPNYLQSLKQDYEKLENPARTDIRGENTQEVMAIEFEVRIRFKDNVDVSVSFLAIKNVIDAEDIELENLNTVVFDMLNSKRQALTLVF